MSVNLVGLKKLEKKSEYIFVTEYKEYENNLDPILLNELIYKDICSIKKNKVKFKVVGILVWGNMFILIFPKGYSIPTDSKEREKHAQILIQTLLKYRAENKLDIEEAEMLAGEEGDFSENLYTAWQIFNDFVQNGILNKTEKEKVLNDKNIDWQATINKTHPLFSGDSIIYASPVSRRRVNNQQHLLVKLQNFCVFRSVEKYGWLFEVSHSELDLEVRELPCDIRYAINYLIKELNYTFKEREQIVIKMLIDFLQGIEAEQSDEKLNLLATPYFHNVWEKVCGQIFDSQYELLKSIIPKTNWEISGNAKVHSQRPDIMILKNEILYILDAKYYDIESNLPGWSDIVKQLFYSYTIFKNITSERFTTKNEKLDIKLKNIKEVNNSFLFPSNHEEPIKRIGKVSVENNEDLKDVAAYQVNTFFAMNCYLEKKKYNFLMHIS